VQVEPQWTLRETLQKAVGLTGCAKMMCDRGACGSCSVLIDGVPALSCTTLAVECEGRRIETSEGIAADPTWRPLVEAYARNDAAQCGYCTPGQFTVAKYIIEKYGQPTEDQIRYELSGNICRCGTYARHVKAITEAAAQIKGGE
jgi:aerobic-type carbon monoxide dehydrogenase small subunit (CoxS/CutS family)